MLQPHTVQGREHVAASHEHPPVQAVIEGIRLCDIDAFLGQVAGIDERLGMAMRKGHGEIAAAAAHVDDDLGAGPSRQNGLRLPPQQFRLRTRAQHGAFSAQGQPHEGDAVRRSAGMRVRAGRER